LAACAINVASAPNAKIPVPPMISKFEIAADWLTRYTGMPLDRFGKYVLLTNFRDYVQRFAARFSCDIFGDNRPMQAATNDAGLTIINFGIGSPNAATIMDLLTAYQPKAVLFLGKCGGLQPCRRLSSTNSFRKSW
jgi:AMP nucleosidase